MEVQHATRSKGLCFSTQIYSLGQLESGSKARNPDRTKTLEFEITELIYQLRQEGVIPELDRKATSGLQKQTS